MTAEAPATPDVAELTRRLNVLESEADIRRLMARYMWLCDTPLPEHPGDLGPNERIKLIMELYAEDAVWEGVGPFYDGQFGHSKGHEQLIEHFEGFFITKTDTQNEAAELLLNAHYLTSEHITVHEGGDTADGQWIHMQPWLFSDGSALLRSSRLHNGFRKVDGVWKITRYRTENVFVAPLPNWFASNYPAKSVLTQGL
ncbi:MAG: nuclear transport factor 2 family protein [Microbacterium sp.]|nr:MAG: nuclear transport factor 2 family protein [Microbacterium sp.]